MKSLKLITIGTLLFFASTIHAQNQCSTQCSDIKSGITGNAAVKYYFLPDIEAYYDVQASKFIYREGNIWIHNANLPVKFKDYDLYCAYKIDITGNINFDMPKSTLVKRNSHNNMKADSLNVVKENNDIRIAQLQVENDE